MKKFADMGITVSPKNFSGDKIKIDRLINKQITVYDFKIEDSKFEKGSGKCLHLSFQMGETPYVCFSGSRLLMEAIQKVSREDFPFTTTIIKHLDTFQFS